MSPLARISATVRQGFVAVLPLVAGSVALAAFALGGAGGPLGLGALLLVSAWGLTLLPRPSLFVVWPSFGLALLLPQAAPGIYFFDVVVFVLGIAVVFWTLAQDDERVWEIHTPGWIALATLIVPLFALPLAVVSGRAFFAEYKNYVGFVVIFLALRRLVPRHESNSLLWFAPVVGTIASLQLFQKTAGVSVVNILRIEMRNFHTRLSWGQSNYVADVIVLCLGMTVLLMTLDRRPWVRLVLLGACVLMMKSFVILFARTPVISVLVFLLVVILGRGGRAAIFSIAAGLATALAFVFTPYGTALMMRFTDPTAYASTGFRILIYKSAWARFLQFPWSGIGLNQGRLQRDSQGDAHAHNTMLDYLSEQGLFGGILYLVLLAAIVRVSLRIVPSTPSVHPRTVRTLCLAILAAVIINSMAEPCFHGYVHAVVFTYFAAWLTLQDEAPNRAPDLPARA